MRRAIIGDQDLLDQGKKAKTKRDKQERFEKRMLSQGIQISELTIEQQMSLKNEEKMRQRKISLKLKSKMPTGPEVTGGDGIQTKESPQTHKSKTLQNQDSRAYQVSRNMSTVISKSPDKMSQSKSGTCSYTNKTFTALGSKANKNNISSKNLHGISERTYQKICRRIAKRVVRNEEEFNLHASQQFSAPFSPMNSHLFPTALLHRAEGQQYNSNNNLGAFKSQS